MFNHQEQLERDGYVVVASTHPSDMGDVFVINTLGDPLEGVKVVVIGESSFEEWVTQVHERLGGVAIPRWYRHEHFYRVIVE
jgi:hypothetical protein